MRKDKANSLVFHSHLTGRFSFDGIFFQQNIIYEIQFAKLILTIPLGRWSLVDSLAAKFPSMSPYVALGNNPIMFVDLIAPADWGEFNNVMKGVINFSLQVSGRVSDSLGIKTD